MFLNWVNIVRYYRACDRRKYKIGVCFESAQTVEKKFVFGCSVYAHETCFMSQLNDMCHFPAEMHDVAITGVTSPVTSAAEMSRRAHAQIKWRARGRRSQATICAQCCDPAIT